MNEEIFEPEVEETVETEPVIESEPEVLESEPSPEPEIEEADPQPQKRDNDFARMRRSMEQQFQSSAEYKLAQKLAQKYGTSVDQIVAQLEEAELTEQAQKAQVPVEFLKKQQEMEAKLNKYEEERVLNTIQSQINDFKTKNTDVSDQDLIPALEFLGRAHRLGENTLTLEQAFKATNSNYESNLRERLRQEILAEMAETKAPIVTKGVSPDQGTRTANDLSDAELDKLLARVKAGERITSY